MGFDGLCTGRVSRETIIQPHGRRAPYYPVACKYRAWNTSESVSRETLRTLSTGEVVEVVDHREHPVQTYNRYKTTRAYISFGDTVEYGLDKHARNEVAYISNKSVHIVTREELKERANEARKEEQRRAEKSKTRWTRAKKLARACDVKKES